jgi:hypothetical protein
VTSISRSVFPATRMLRTSRSHLEVRNIRAATRMLRTSRSHPATRMLRTSRSLQMRSSARKTCSCAMVQFALWWGQELIWSKAPSPPRETL